MHRGQCVRDKTETCRTLLPYPKAEASKRHHLFNNRHASQEQNRGRHGAEASEQTSVLTSEQTIEQLGLPRCVWHLTRHERVAGKLVVYCSLSGNG